MALIVCNFIKLCFFFLEPKNLKINLIFQLAESDYEVSQFDSLDNCSDGGMSAENFNTLKKGPLPPTIDPPPEFQVIYTTIFISFI